MPINRAPFNALVDDDGSNLHGTIWGKTQIKDVVLDPADAAYAPLVSPAFTGSPTAPTAPAGAVTTQIANTTFVQAAAGGPWTPWTPADQSGAGLALVVGSCSYSKANRLVFFNMTVTWPTTASGVGATVNGPPFAAIGQFGVMVFYSGYGTPFAGLLQGSPQITFYSAGGVQLTNANLSGKLLVASGWFGT